RALHSFPTRRSSDLASGKEVAVRDSSPQKLTNYSPSSVQDTQRYVRIRSQIDEYAEHVDPRMRVASPRCGFRPVDEMVLGLRHSGCRSSIRAPLDESIARGLCTDIIRMDSAVVHWSP